MNDPLVLGDKLVPIDDVISAPDIRRFRNLLGAVHTRGVDLVSKSQVARIQRLVTTAETRGTENPHPTSLFPSDEEMILGRCTSVVPLRGEAPIHTQEDLLAQLLPYWIESADQGEQAIGDTWKETTFPTLFVSSSNLMLNNRIRAAFDQISTSANSKITQFARSAHYMGSKSTLAPLFNEVLSTFLPSNSVVLDLMCGSGAAAGAFSHFWPTIASDAQAFSLDLATVQGGGMTGSRAKELADRIIALARKCFGELPQSVLTEIDIESEFLACELTDDVLAKLGNWIRGYPRVGNSKAFASHPLRSMVTDRQANPRIQPYLLFTTYYSNLFFGVRQAAEIDCLRSAIDQEIKSETERSWALGALVCAVSSCAYSYGGHFAQPKLDAEDSVRFEGLVPGMLVSRGLSVSHEFYVRLTNLGSESEKTKHPVLTLQGPWERAIEHAATLIKDNSPVCVYFDPPYTRDEYSRYYHVLETLIRYDYPNVQDKPSVPKRGSESRFASEFATRNVAQVEKSLRDVIRKCLDRNWYCLWSYSSGGDADIERVLTNAVGFQEKIDIFCTDYSYKAQGKHSAKSVKEYAIMISPANL